MTKKPWLNALLALLYIVIIASLMYTGSHVFPQKDNIFMPIAFLSLLTLSAATMGFLFFYQPFQMYFNGEKSEAVKLFLQTLGCFAAFTIVAFLLILVVK